MGSIAKALFRNRLSRLTQGLQDMADRKQGERETADFLKEMYDVYEKNRGRYYEQEFYDKQPEPDVGDSDPNVGWERTDSLGDIKPRGLGKKSTLEEQLDESLVESGIEKEKFGNLEGPMNEVPITDPEQLREAGRKGQRDVWKMLMGNLGNEQLDFGKVQAGATMLQKLLELRERPETDYFNLGKDETRFGQTEEGDRFEVASGKGGENNYVGPELDENGEEVTYEMDGQTYYNEQTITPDGEIIKNIRKRVPKQGEGSTNITNYIPPDYSTIEKDLSLAKSDYNYYKEEHDENYAKLEKIRVDNKELFAIEDDDLSDEEKEKREILKGEIDELQAKVDEAQENKDAMYEEIVSDVRAKAVRWSSKEGFEGFNLMFNKLFGKLKGKSPKEIDKTVQEAMKGGHPEAIMAMKQILRDVIFEKKPGVNWE